MSYAKIEPAVLALGVGSFAATTAGWLTQAIYAAGSRPGGPFDFQLLFALLLFGLLMFPLYAIVAAVYSTPLLLVVWLPAWLLRLRFPFVWTRVAAPIIGGLLGLGSFRLIECIRHWPHGNNIYTDLHPEMTFAAHVGGFVSGAVMFAIGAHFHSRSTICNDSYHSTTA